MAKHIGIVSCSAEGASLCYRTICHGAASLMGEYFHPEVSTHTYPLGRYLEQIRAGEWDRVAELMLSSSRKLASAGADFLICPDNTIHQAFDRVASESPLPWIHIAEPVTSRAREKELKKLLIMGTEFLMSGPVYPDFLSKAGIAFEIPDDEDRRLINNIIFNELVNGIFTRESRAYFDTVIHFMKDRGCDGVVMGCTEIPLLLDPAVSPLPLLDSTRLLAEAAVREALRED